MARIAIFEPNAEVGDLLERVVRRLGHDPVRPASDLELPEADIAIVEPAAPGGSDLVRALHEAGVATIIVSIYPPSPEIRRLEPAAHVLKPFSLAQLEAAVLDATRAQTGGASASVAANPE